MISIELLKQSFTRMKSGEIMVKNWILPFVFLTMLFPMVILIIVFLGVFIAKEPMTFNDQIVMPGDPEYTSSFITTFVVMGSVIVLLLIALAITLFTKPKAWVYWMYDYDNNLVIYEVTPRYFRYILSDRMIQMNRLTNSLYETDSASEIREHQNRTLFWTLLDYEDRIAINIKNDSYKLTYNLVEKKQKFTYRLFLNSNLIISKYYETVSSYGNSSNSVSSMKVARVENLNRLTRLPIDPIIAQALLKSI